MESTRRYFKKGVLSKRFLTSGAIRHVAIMCSLMSSAFISYSTNNRDVAKRLHDDLQLMGVHVFQFEESAEPGAPAWRQVFASIKKSDWFFLLISHSSNESRAVQEELEFAHHFQMNSESSLPTLVPLMLESVGKPDLIASRTELSFAEYDSGLAALGKLINIDSAPKPVKEKHSHKLDAEIKLSERKAKVGDTVFVKITVRNEGVSVLDDVVVRLSNSIFCGPSTLAVGETIEQEIPIQISKIGKTQRTVRITALDSLGRQIKKSRRVTVSGTESSTAQAENPELPTADLVESSKRRALQRPDPRAYMETSSLPLLLTVLALGAVLNWLAFLGGDMLVNWARGADFPEWVNYLPHAIAGWASWIRLLTGIVLGLVCIGIGFIVAEEEVVVDVVDGVLVTIWSALLGAVVGTVWSYSFAVSTSDPLLVLAIAGGSVLGVFGVLLYILLDEMDALFLILVIGTLYLVGVYFGSGYLVDWFRGAELSGWMVDIPAALDNWASWLRVLIVIVFGIICIVVGAFIEDEIIIVDAVEAFWGVTWCVLVGATAGIVWSFMFSVSATDFQMVLVITAGAAMSILGALLLTLFD